MLLDSFQGCIVRSNKSCCYAYVEDLLTILDKFRLIIDTQKSRMKRVWRDQNWSFLLDIDWKYNFIYKVVHERLVDYLCKVVLDSYSSTCIFTHIDHRTWRPIQRSVPNLNISPFGKNPTQRDFWLWFRLRSLDPWGELMSSVLCIASIQTICLGFKS